MKFPKSLHAEGWSDHLDSKSPTGDLPRTAKPAGAPLRGAKPLTSGMRMNPPEVAPAMSTTPPVTPRVEPHLHADAGSAARTATVRPTPERDTKPIWMLAAGAGAAVIAALAIWGANRPSEAPVTPPALVTGSTAPQAEVAAATPLPEASETAATPADDTTVAAAAETPAEPAPASPSITTVRPAVEARQVAQAPVPAPRPDLVVRADPRSSSQQPERTTPYLVPQAPVVATAPAPEVQPLTVTPGTGPIVMPPTAAGPTTAQPAATPPVASTPGVIAPATPEPAVPSTSPGTAPLAQAPAQPSAEDSGITNQVRTALASDSTLVNLPISVTTAQGVVRLEGQAPDAPTRERATVVAASANGVKAVDNRLTLPAAPLVSQAPATISQ